VGTISLIHGEIFPIEHRIALRSLTLKARFWLKTLGFERRTHRSLTMMRLTSRAAARKSRDCPLIFTIPALVRLIASMVRRDTSYSDWDIVPIKGAVRAWRRSPDRVAA